VILQDIGDEGRGKEESVVCLLYADSLERRDIDERFANVIALSIPQGCTSTQHHATMSEGNNTKILLGGASWGTYTYIKNLQPSHIANQN
jgi:hypothetical protein